MRVSPAAMRSHSPWAADLRHPLTLGAVAVLALNDHVLKGSGLLPAAVTGKLSDVAGLFFFPILLVAIARLVLPERLGASRGAAFTAIAATGAAFALLKLHAPFNAWATSVWGVNVMDATDLWALPVLPLSAAFMMRRGRAARGDRAPSRPFLDLAAASAAGIASLATSHAPPPPPVAPQAMVVEGCASVAPIVCERSATLTYVVIEATGTGSGSCVVEVVSASEIGMVTTAADMIPAPMRVDPGRRANVSLAFPRPVSPEERSGTASLRLDLRVGGVPRSLDSGIECRAR